MLFCISQKIKFLRWTKKKDDVLTHLERCITDLKEMKYCKLIIFNKSNSSITQVVKKWTRILYRLTENYIWASGEYFGVIFFFQFDCRLSRECNTFLFAKSTSSDDFSVMVHLLIYFITQSLMLLFLFLRIFFSGQ